MCIYICTYVCMYIYMCIYVYIYIYIFRYCVYPCMRDPGNHLADRGDQYDRCGASQSNLQEAPRPRDSTGINSYSPQ